MALAASGGSTCVGVLMGSNAGDPQMQARVTALTEGLKELGWSEKTNFQIRVLWDGGSLDKATQNAKALSEMPVDVVVANGTIGIEAASKVIRRLPIVFAMVGAPVGSGFVQSLAHPGGNITGFSAFEPEITGKWIEVLKEIAPATKRVIVLSYPGYEFFWHGAEAVADKLGVEASEVQRRDATEIGRLSVLAIAPGAGLMSY